MDPKHLICFKNGVYDFTTHQFRLGVSDCCTLNTDYHYQPTYDPGLWVYLHKVFPENEDYHLFMKSMDLLFRGHHQIINENGETGSNGITTLCCLINTMFGSYGKIINHILNQRENTSDTELNYLRNHFKGRYLMSLTSSNNISTRCTLVKSFTSLITINEKLNNVIDLKFKSTFSLPFTRHFMNDSPSQYNFTPIDNLIDQLPSFALTLMTKLIALQEEPIKQLIFYHNNLFVKDITQSILDIYNTMIYN